MQQLQAPLCHYKTCSTFDSSPRVGSIGRALEIGQEIFGSSHVPLVVGAPALRRYCLFGNLFATVEGETHRLDRHPTMSRHPVTPMAESDLRVHLAAQTSKRIGLLDILALRSKLPREALQRLLEQGSEVILFDVFDDASLRQVGSLLWNSRSQPQSFLVGSSGVEYALTSWWRSLGWTTPTSRVSLRRRNRSHPGGFRQWLSSHGKADSMGHGPGVCFHCDRRVALAGTKNETDELARVLRLALAELEAGRSVILHTALGPSDTRLLKAASPKHSQNSKNGLASASAGCFARRFCVPTSGASSSAAATPRRVPDRSLVSSL